MRSWITVGCLGALWLGSGRAAAQEPDVRDIPPFVMMVVDTSGSMEDLPACTCNAVNDCTNCQPNCTPDTVLGVVPPGKKNRWAVTLEALTGRFVDFECNPLDRTAANGATYDLGSNLLYHQPWECAVGDQCDYPGPDIQEKNGILDTYLETLRFGLMTFDGEYTYAGAGDQLQDFEFNESLSQSMPGMWSIGGKKEFRYPGCEHNYWVDSGARGKTAESGALVTLDSTTPTCTTPPCDVYSINAMIQDTLLKVRPYGGTPIAASLTDLYDHLQNEVTDPYLSCRKRYAILITDGAPDDDFRDLLCDCGDTMTSPACPEGVPEDFKCPYLTSPEIAKQLVSGDATALPPLPKQIDKLYVLGMSVSDVGAKATLDEIADAGGTSKALQADDPNTLRSTLDSVFSPLLNPISRSVPGFATGLNGTQYQVSTGFQVSSASLTTTTAPPWTGLIERRSFVCGSDGELDAADLEDKDRFHKVINDETASARKLYTALPAGTVSPTVVKLELSQGSTNCNGACETVKLDDTRVTESVLTVGSATERTDLFKWMNGSNGSPREGRMLGDIYHSSPTLIGRPLDEPADDAYTRFRDRPEVKERPLVLYVATNDGILHAISVEDYPVDGYPITVHASQAGLPMRAGHEIWGFVPPILLPKLKEQLTSHQYNLDATPVVKDVYFQRGSSASETEYHSVLVMGMRGGGNGYFALDVTDPLADNAAPKFLWQFTDPDMGETYGQPEIVQATFEWPLDGSATPSIQTRAVAILSGGRGDPSLTDAPGCAFNQTLSMRKSGGSEYSSFFDDSPTSSTGSHRSAVQCWKKTGRALYFVDVETGKLIKKIFDNDTDLSNGIFLPSPIIGSPTAHQSAVGTIADRGFVMDADGVLWRIDMSSTDVVASKPDKGWTMRPFHDVFWDKKIANGGETSYERPILSLDQQRRLVVIVGTGDTDNFEKPGADNRIVSLTEIATQDTPDEPEDYMALINWELRNEGPSGDGLVPTELVTGTMALFEGQLFAATFISNAGSGDACEYGRGRLWSLDFQERDKTKQNDMYGPGVSETPRTFRPLEIAVTDEGEESDDELFNISVSQAEPNLLIQGVGTTQRTTCVAESEVPLDSYFAPQLANIEQTEPPAIWVVAQASKGDKRANSRLGNVQAKIDRRKTSSRVTSWATSVD